MLKKFITGTLIIGLTVPLGLNSVHADTYSDQIENIDIQAKTTKEQLVELTDKIKENQANSKKLLKEIKKQQLQADKLSKRSVQLEDKMEKRRAVLAKQARTLQSNGQTVNYVDFVLNAESVTDAIARVNVVTRLVTANREMFNSQKEDKERVDRAEVKAKNIMNRQRENIVAIEQNAIDLKEQEATKTAVIARLATEKTTIQTKKEVELVRVAAEKAEAAAKKASAAAEKQRKLAAKATKRTTEDIVKSSEKTVAHIDKVSETTASSTEKENVIVADKETEASELEEVKPPAQTGSGYIRPTLAPITSHYGAREGLDASGFHKGTDFGGAPGSPIYASKSGTVVIAQNDGAPVSGYGMATLIQHEDGNYTLYAHQSSQSVHVGDKVSQGQVIGGMGSTGQSTGTHLHFEIRTSMYGGEGNLLNPELFF
ncbi:peptidoglycan DD-metalloendopeptidase family protein [Brochothrix campestris]|uniref:peptidoglycan DD-metalloendopeptidase family protein n=1 Tax=Brochothrix campestris TaxID=2757 RepID=UPI0038D0AEF9